MVRYKVVFKDQDAIKTIFGNITFSTEENNPLVKIISDDGNLIFVNRSNIIFMKEIIGRENFDY